MDAILKSQAEQLVREMATQATTLDDLNGLMRAMMKTALERMLNTEMDVHLGRRAEPGGTNDNPTPNASTTSVTENAPATPKNRRNGHSQKTLSGDMGDNHFAIVFEARMPTRPENDSN
jgi:transposase-like protein